MLNIHIIGDGTILYSIKTLIELHLDKFKDEVQVTCFGDHYLNPAYVRKFTPSLTFDDIIRKADIVICTNPIYEDDNIMGICAEYNVPLICTFRLAEKTKHPTNFILDDINLQMAASDLWIKRLVDVSENLKSIKHFVGISKLYDTGDDALPGLTMEEYQQATDRVLGQPHLIRLQDKYYFASETENWQEGNVDISTNWIADSDRIDANRISRETLTLFHTEIITDTNDMEEDLVKHSHLAVPGRRSLPSWYYTNACVVCSFVYMWHKDFIPKGCTDYMQLDHNTFSNNVFGQIFRIA